MLAKASVGMLTYKVSDSPGQCAQTGRMESLAITEPAAVREGDGESKNYVCRWNYRRTNLQAISVALSGLGDHRHVEQICANHEGFLQRKIAISRLGHEVAYHQPLPPGKIIWYRDNFKPVLSPI